MVFVKTFATAHRRSATVFRAATASFAYSLRMVESCFPTTCRILVQELVPKTPRTRGGVTEAIFGGNIARIP